MATPIQLERQASTTAEQGAAPDRLQLHSFRSFLTSLIPLPVAAALHRYAPLPRRRRCRDLHVRGGRVCADLVAAAAADG